MPSHTRRGAFGTTVGVGFVLNPLGADCFVRGVTRRILLLLFSVFVGSVDLSVGDAIKLDRAVVALGEMSCCGSTGCLSCQGKQSTSSSLLLLFIIIIIIIVGAVIFNIIVGFIFAVFIGGGVRGGLNKAITVGNCGGKGFNGSRRGMPWWFGWDRHRKYHGGRCCCLLGGVREGT